MSLGETIKRRRIQCGLKLRQVSERCGISVTYLSQIERGTRIPRQTHVLKRIAEALALDESFLTKVHLNSTMLRDDAPKLLEALRDLHDFSMPIRSRSHADRSNKAFSVAAELLQKHGG